ncbi:MAG: cell division protein FtsX [Flavobacteriaceae bacterium]
MKKKNIEHYQRRKLLNSYFSVVLSITFVLFFLGVLGLFLINGKKIASHFKEQIAMSIYLKDNAKDIEITQLQKKIQLDSATKSINFITKEEAAEKYIRDIGEDFLEFLGYNPLLNSIDINFNSNYVNTTNLEKRKKEIESIDFVDEVVYDNPLVKLLDENIKKITLILLFITSIFVLIAVILINSSIRLSIYSKRFLIKTMQLVGATKSFVRKPFIWNHVRLGIISSIVSLIALSTIIVQLDKYLPELKILQEANELTFLFIGIISLGIGITALSTFFATQKYLNLKSNSFY